MVTKSSSSAFRRQRRKNRRRKAAQLDAAKEQGKTERLLKQRLLYISKLVALQRENKDLKRRCQESVEADAVITALRTELVSRQELDSARESASIKRLAACNALNTQLLSEAQAAHTEQLQQAFHEHRVSTAGLRQSLKTTQNDLARVRGLRDQYQRERDAARAEVKTLQLQLLRAACPFT